MSLTWHIIKKDLRRIWPALLVFFVLLYGLYLFLHYPDRHYPSFTRNDLNKIRAFMVCSFLAFFAGIIGSIFQEDNAADTSADWRTRPISGLRLVAAKGLLISVVLIAFPLLFAAIAGPSEDQADYNLLNVQLKIGSTLIALAASSAAVASISRDLSRFALSAVTLVVICMLLTWLLESGRLGIYHLSPAEWERYRPYINSSRRVVATLVGLVIGALGSMAVVNQYCTHRTKLTIGFIALGVLAFNALATFWPWITIRFL